MEGKAADGFVQRRRRRAKASGLCWPLSLKNQHMCSHMAQQTRKGITAFYKVLHALCKGRVHCWMIINPQCICNHLKRFQGACWACHCCAGESRGRMLSAAGCNREYSKVPEITSLFCLSGRFTRGRASEDLCNACWWFLIWPELGAEVGVSGGWRSLLPSHPSEAQSRFLDQKEEKKKKSLKC